MRVYSPVTDYIRRSLISTTGDLVVRGAAIPERLPAGADGTFFKGKGAGVIPAYEVLDGDHNNILRAKGAGVNPVFEPLAGTIKHYLKGLGAGVNPGFSALRLDDVGVKIGSGSHSVAGLDVVSGVGYKASVILFFAVDSTMTRNCFSGGFATVAENRCIYLREDNSYMVATGSYCIFIQRDAGNYFRGVITVIGDDGFTLNWDLAGICGAAYIYLCLP